MKCVNMLGILGDFFETSITSDKEERLDFWDAVDRKGKDIRDARVFGMNVSI